MRALYQDIWREIKNTKQRFLSIFFIVTLGVAFFAGVRASNPDMRISADTYVDEYKLADIRLMSTLGFAEEDLEYIRGIEGVESVEGTWFSDVLCYHGGSELVLQLLANMKEFNQIEVLSGRLPVRKTECLIDRRLAGRDGLKIGDVIEVIDESDSLVTTKLEVVGIGNHAGFIATSRGSTTIGNGEISGFVIVNPDLFSNQDIFTQVCIRVEGSEVLLSHSKEYDALIETVMECLEMIEEEQCQLRYETVLKDATEALLEGKAELADAKQEAQEEFAKAEQELTDAQKELDDGKAELAQKEQELLDGFTKLEEAEKELAKAKEELAKGEAELLAGQTEIQTNELMITMGKEQLAEGEYQLALLKALYPSNLISIEQINVQIAEAEKTLRDTKAMMADAEQQIIAGKVKIAESEKQIADAKAQIEAGEKEIAENRILLEDGKKQLEDGKLTLADGEQELQDGWKEFREKKAEAEEEIAKAEVEIADAEEALLEIEVATWYIMDRNDYPDFITVGQNADRIGALGEVFPVIFFIIAALVSLTTMTRMVEEQRTQVGTMKALGYSKFQVSLKYIVYATAATVGGSILGVLIGEKLIPWVIITAYGIVYLPFKNAICPYEWYYSLMGCGLALLCTLGATLFSCFHALQSVPASLMRPVAPKQGKRVLLEHIPFIWRRLNFGNKATIRNLFRYKKRFLMTLFGIGSCTSLLIVGFGIRDSIGNIAIIQYSKIQQYDGILQMKENVSEEVKETLQNAIAESEDIRTSTAIYMKTMEVLVEDTTREAYVCIPKSIEEFEQMNVFRNRISGVEYHLTDEGAIITEQMATALGVKKGDKISLKSGDKVIDGIVVADITENYMMHYVYMTPNYYEEIFKEQPEYSVLLYDLTEEALEREKEIGAELLEYEATYGISYVSESKETITTMLGTLNIVMVVLIGAAGLLAYIVIYNLNNINITERRRELATIKVLGFYDGEVAMYVYRENVLLTLLGILGGCAFGKWLHQFIILTVEVDMVMFGREIMGMSYVYSGLFTIVFALLVNWIMYYKLKEINMVESLKSVE